MNLSFLPTTTHKITNFTKALIGLLLIAFFAGVAFLFPALPVNESPVVFDHSQCQYPDRLTNPIDGCDNSDPAVPENTNEIKGVSGSTNTTLSDKNAVSQNIESVEKPVEAVEYNGILRDNFGNPIKGK